MSKRKHTSSSSMERSSNSMELCSSSSSMELCSSSNSMELCSSSSYSSNSMELCSSPSSNSMELCSSPSSSNGFCEQLKNFLNDQLINLLLKFYGIDIINEYTFISKKGNVFIIDFEKLFVEKALTRFLFEFYGGNYFKIQPYMFVMTIYIGDTKYRITDKQYIGDALIISDPKFNVEIYYL